MEEALLVLKNISYLCLFICLNMVVSCSSYRPPESIDEKMKRFNTNYKTSNRVPQIMVQPLLLQGRSPASIPSLKTLQKNNKRFNISNKRLYFIGLFEQYQQISQFSEEESPKINSCPHFHSNLIDNQTAKKNNQWKITEGIVLAEKVKIYRQALNNPSLFPELHLPLDEQNLHPTVYDYFKNNSKEDDLPGLIQNAIEIHLKKTYNEINELCQTGSSENYYIYENLTSIGKKSKFKRSKQSLQTLLKTTIFSNMALNASLRAVSKNHQQTDLSFTNYEAEIIKRLDSQWVAVYLSNMISKRKY